MLPFARSLFLVGAAGIAGIAGAQPTSPTYHRVFNDCVTSDNIVRDDDGALHWFVDPGCDIYQNEVYERPTTQTYERVRRRFAAAECFEYLDITQGKWGFDSRYLYVAIDLFGRNHRTSDGNRIPVGMMERYGFRFSMDPDGRFGMLVVADQPQVKNSPNTRYGPLGVFVHLDTNGDVGGADDDGPTGRNVTKSDNPDEEDGMNGYDAVIVSDGRLSDERRVAWVRLDPTDNTVVELAIDYRALGFTSGQIGALGSLDLEAIKGGPKDPQNYLWNDKYTRVEAGSPNPGRRGRSEFGTTGLGAIYEVDTLRAPSSNAVHGGDFNGDGDIDSADLALFIDALDNASPEADIDLDGDVDSADLERLLEGIIRE